MVEEKKDPFMSNRYLVLTKYYWTWEHLNGKNCNGRYPKFKLVQNILKNILVLESLKSNFFF